MLKLVPLLKEQFSFYVYSGSEFTLLEVPPERVTNMEELGQGAFGIVYKSVMRDLSKKNKSPKLGNQNLDTHQGRVVATKVLHGESVQNMTEIEVML